MTEGGGADEKASREEPHRPRWKTLQERRCQDEQGREAEERDGRVVPHESCHVHHRNARREVRQGGRDGGQDEKRRRDHAVSGGEIPRADEVRQEEDERHDRERCEPRREKAEPEGTDGRAGEDREERHELVAVPVAAPEAPVERRAEDSGRQELDSRGHDRRLVLVELRHPAEVAKSEADKQREQSRDDKVWDEGRHRCSEDRPHFGATRTAANSS